MLRRAYLMNESISLHGLKALAAFAAITVDRLWYYPVPGQNFVTDADFVISADEQGEYLRVWHCGETCIHVSQLDRPTFKADDPDINFQDWRRNEHTTG